nr:MAG TPA: hypothetical protein [Caudoviricetes sp.]
MTENANLLFFGLLRRLCFWRKSRGKTWGFRFPLSHLPARSALNVCHRQTAPLNGKGSALDPFS